MKAKTSKLAKIALVLGAFLLAVPVLAALDYPEEAMAEQTLDGVTWSSDYKQVTISKVIDGDILQRELEAHWGEFENVHFTGTSGISKTAEALFGDQDQLKTVTFDQGFSIQGVTDFTHFFCNCTNLTKIDGLQYWDVSEVTGEFCFAFFFDHCEKLTNESFQGMSNWDVSNVMGYNCMDSMFRHCLGLTNLDFLKTWDVSNVSGSECMIDLFTNCKNLESIDGISSWNIEKAQASWFGVHDMLHGLVNLKSITIGAHFVLSDDFAGVFGGDVSDMPQLWFSEKGTSATTPVDAQTMVARCADVATYGTHWYRA